MKNLLVFYRIASYILVAIAALLAIAVLFSLPLALSSAINLLNVLILVAVIIYTFTSFVFFIKGIQKQQQCKASLKDWIKVNAYVAIAFGVLSLIGYISFLATPANMNAMITQMNDMTEKTKTPPMPKGVVTGIIRGVLYFMIAYSLLLLWHLMITLRLVKEHAALFGDTSAAE